MNNEYYSSQDLNRFDEWKPFPAEAYRRVSDTNTISDEIKKQGHEFTPQAERVAKKQSHASVGQVVDKISKAVTKMLTGVAATVATAAVVVGVYMGVSKPAPDVLVHELNAGTDYVEYSLELNGLDSELDYAITVENPYHSFEIDVDGDGAYEGLVTGLKPDLQYTLSVIGREENDTSVYYEEKLYTTKTDTPVAVFDIDARSYDGQGAKIDYSVYISDYYKRGSGYYLEFVRDGQAPPVYSANTLENGFFKGSFYDAEGGWLTLRICCQLDGEAYTVGEYKLIAFEPTKVETPEAPRVEILAVEIYSTNLLKIEYIINDTTDGLYSYEQTLLDVQFAGGEMLELIEEQAYPNVKRTATVELPEGVVEASVSASLKYKDENGKVELVNSETETLPLSASLEYEVLALVSENRVRLLVDYFLTSNAVIVIEQDGEVISEFGIYDYIEWTHTSQESPYICYVRDENGEILVEESSFLVSMPTEAPDYEFTYMNPNEILVTYNEDGTMNLYVLVNFATEDTELYCEVKIGTESYVMRDRVLEIEKLPVDTYSVIYSVVKEIDGVKYAFYHVAPSGTVGDGIYYNVNAVISDKHVEFELGQDMQYNFDGFKAVSSLGEEIYITEDMIFDDEERGCYTVSLELSRAAEYITLYIKLYKENYFYDEISSLVEINGVMWTEYEIICYAE